MPCTIYLVYKINPKNRSTVAVPGPAPPPRVSSTDSLFEDPDHPPPLIEFLAPILT